MYNFRYYAIGHSYLKHGPFDGWQTSGFWGMAASAPECDYFHKFQEGLKKSIDCRIDAIAENHAAYERLCTEDATEEKYTSSQEYAHMREVLEEFKPNIITLFIGGGNTPAKDDVSLTRFFEVLYKLVADCKCPEAVVLCTTHSANFYRLLKPVAEKYGFVCVDTSFIHQVKGRDNVYYAFREYPEYDERVAMGAVEFRTHPNDKGHAAIADAFLLAARNALEKIPEDAFTRECSYRKCDDAQIPAKLKIKTVPQMNVSYFGFNVRQLGELVTFGSAPGTGASLAADNFLVSEGYQKFYTEMLIDGASESDVLKISLMGSSGVAEFNLPIAPGMHTYEIDVPSGYGEIRALRLAPSAKECVVSIRQIGFKK